MVVCSDFPGSERAAEPVVDAPVAVSEVVTGKVATVLPSASMSS